MDSMLNYNGFYKRKTGSGSAYNYELAPLIDSFSFYDFVKEGMRKKDISGSHGGFLVITNHQYIVGYNADFGSGTHAASFSRTMKDLTGGGPITNFRDATHLNVACTRNYLCARLLFEYVGVDNENKPIYDGSLVFLLPDVGYKITPEQFEIFKKFYEDYNDDIKYVISKVGARNFQVRYQCLDEKGNRIQKFCNSLDELYEYLSSCIDSDKTNSSNLY